MFDLTAGDRDKAALLLVHSKYSAQLAPFVKNSKTRLAYVGVQLSQIVDEACEQTGADFDSVLAAFNEHLAEVLDAVLKNPGNAKREELTNPDASEPYAKNLSPDSKEGLESIVDADVLDRGDVAGAGAVEALKPDARVDLNAETADPNGSTEVEHKSSCFRCGAERVASISPVCAKCNAELLKLAYVPGESDNATGWGAAAPEPGVQESPVANPNLPYTCTICGQEGAQDEIRAHINRDHADVLQRQDEQSTQNMGQDNLGVQQQMSSTKESVDLQMVALIANSAWALVSAYGTWNSYKIYQGLKAQYPQVDDQTIQQGIQQAEQEHHQGKTADVPRAEDAAEVEPLPQNPGDKFDEYVQRLAETAAARKFSQLSDEDIHSIASQIGASPDDVRNGIVCVAVFGDNVAVNGQLGGDPSPPEGYEEISAQGLSGQQPTHDAMVPTDLVVSSVANEMNMSPELAYQQIKDKYGADLPTKYHASISGQVHYYLPSDIAGNQQAQQQQQQQQQQQTGPAAPPAPQVQPQRPLAPTQ